MHRIAVAIAALIGVFIALPAWAQSEIIITQAKALAGNITPGDTAGYPITLSQPGAYVLGSNLTVPNNQYGIFAGADNIDIDLNGFTLTGNGGGTYGIVSNKGQGSIHGGSIKLFRASGVYLRGDAWTVEDMQILSNAGMGIDATGSRFNSVHNSLIAGNSLSGIIIGNDGVFSNNVVSSNGSDGIICEEDCSVEKNKISLNNGNGLSIASGLVDGNNFYRNYLFAVRDAGEIDTGMSSNILLFNNTTGAIQSQRYGTFVISSNGSRGKAY